MKFRLFQIVLKAAILLVLVMAGGCASEEKVMTLSPVGPKSGGSAGSDGRGHLIVYNASFETVNRDGAMAYPHDGYRIYDQRKACIKRVSNRSGAEGEIPERVDLSPGRYTIVTLSETQGAVAVPVIIKSSLTTEVNLEQPRRFITPNSMASN